MFLVCIAAVAGVSLASCHHGHCYWPEPDNPGPTPSQEHFVTVKTNCVLDIDGIVDLDDMPMFTTVDLGSVSPGSSSAADGSQTGGPGRAGEPEYDIRYTIDVFNSDTRDDSRAERRIIVTLPAGDATSRSLDSNLQPGEYRLRVWADYVPAGTDDDKFYTTGDLRNISIIPNRDGTHPGNTHYRDAFVGTVTVEVPQDIRYASSWDHDSIVDRHTRVTLERPQALYYFMATDLRKFLSGQASDAESAAAYLEACKVRVRYTGYMPWVFNIVTDRPVDSKLGQEYNAQIQRIDADRAILAFDHVFVGENETSVDVALEIYDPSGTLVSSVGPVTVPLNRGRYTLVEGDFLSATSAGGVGIDPHFKGEFNIEIE